MWQSLSDPNVWLMLDENLSQKGVLLCYVDDLLVLAPFSERQSLLAHIASIWTCSPVVYSESGDLTYCGLELSSSDSGIFLRQDRYVKELLKRHDVSSGSDTPCPSWKESYDDANSREDNPCIQQVRAAQSLVGELSAIKT